MADGIIYKLVCGFFRQVPVFPVQVFLFLQVERGNVFPAVVKGIGGKEIHVAVHGENAIISTPDSKVKVVVIPTDEEYMIASDTYELVK